MSDDRPNHNRATPASRWAPTDVQWRAAKLTYSPGTHVNGVVLSHHRFGFFVDLFEPVVGLVELFFITDRPSTDNSSEVDEFPAVGAEIQAVVLGAVDHNRQIRLSMRPSDRAQAIRGAGRPEN